MNFNKNKILQSNNTTEKTNLENCLSVCNTNSHLIGNTSEKIINLKEHKTNTSIHWCFRSPLQTVESANGGSSANTTEIDNRLAGLEFEEKDTEADIATDPITVTHNSKKWECIKKHTSDSTNEPESGEDYLTYWKETQEETQGGSWAISINYTSYEDALIDNDYE